MADKYSKTILKTKQVHKWGKKKWVKPKDLNCKNMGHSTDAECYEDGLSTFLILIVVVRQSSLLV